MNIKKLLLHRYINNAAIAADLFPNQKYPRQTLNNKLNEVFAGTGRQRITEKDEGRVIALFERFLKDVRYRGFSRSERAAALVRPQGEYLRESIIRKEQFTGAGGKFYPVHLENEELSSVIGQVLESLLLYGRDTVYAFVRKDRGAKGVDFRVHVTKLWKGEAQRVRQYAFGINSNWEVEGFFDHWVDMINRPAAEEIVGRQIPVLEQILHRRATGDRPPARNELFDGDGWTCIYEHSNRLSNWDI